MAERSERVGTVVFGAGHARLANSYELAEPGCTTSSSSAAGYGWLNSVLGLGVGRRTARAVSYTVYAVQ